MHREVKPSDKYSTGDFFRNGEIPLGILHMDVSSDYPPHTHDFCELVLVYSGTGRHTCGGGDSRIKRGDILYIPPGMKHSYGETEDLSYINVIFDRSLAEGEILPPEEFLFTSIAEYDMKRLLPLINGIDREMYKKEEDYAFMARSLLSCLLIHIKRIFAREVTPGGINSEERVNSVMDHVRRNLSRSYAMKELAASAGMSVRHFSRIFKKEYGTTVVSYINRKRVEESRRLLSDTDLAVTQIAFLAGFEDSGYYSLMFRKIQGEPPTAYRERKKRTALRGKQSDLYKTPRE